MQYEIIWWMSNGVERENDCEAAGWGRGSGEGGLFVVLEAVEGSNAAREWLIPVAGNLT